MSVLIAVFSSANGPAAIFLVAISCDDGKKILGQSYGCVFACVQMCTCCLVDDSVQMFKEEEVAPKK